MSSDAKVWQDKNGWHGICDATSKQLDGDDYDLKIIIEDIEDLMGQRLHWEIFQFTNGLGLRAYRAKSK
jgi:hypothetical protein